jgi:hypothetical protein
MYIHIHVSAYVHVRMFILHLHANYYTLGSSVSLIIAPQSKVKRFFSTSSVSLFYRRKVITSIQVAYLLKTYFHTSFWGHKINIEVSLPPRQFAYPPYWYYLFCDTNFKVFHSGLIEDSRLIKRHWVAWGLLTFRKNVSPLSSSDQGPWKICSHQWPSTLEDEDDKFIGKVRNYLPQNATSHSRRPESFLKVANNLIIQHNNFPDILPTSFKI